MLPNRNLDAWGRHHSPRRADLAPVAVRPAHCIARHPAGCAGDTSTGMRDDISTHIEVHPARQAMREDTMHEEWHRGLNPRCPVSGFSRPTRLLGFGPRDPNCCSRAVGRCSIGSLLGKSDSQQLSYRKSIKYTHVAAGLLHVLLDLQCNFISGQPQPNVHLSMSWLDM
jgi:hypothetical protein